MYAMYVRFMFFLKLCTGTGMLIDVFHDVGLGS